MSKLAREWGPDLKLGEYRTRFKGDSTVVIWCDLKYIND